MKVGILKIKIKGRMRRDLGDVDSLAESLTTFGLINPITVTEKYVLVAGYRRLMAAKRLGWNEIECHVVKASSRKDTFNIEVEENKHRKDFTPSEIELIEEERQYIYATGLQKILLLLRRFFRAVARWFGSLLKRFPRSR